MKLLAILIIIGMIFMLGCTQEINLKTFNNNYFTAEYKPELIPAGQPISDNFLVLTNENKDFVITIASGQDNIYDINELEGKVVKVDVAPIIKEKKQIKK